MTELIEFPVGMIAGIILSSIVVVMIAAKLVCVVSTRYQLRRDLTAADLTCDSDEHTDMLTNERSCPVDSANDNIPSPQSGQFRLSSQPYCRHIFRLSFHGQ